MTSIHPMVEFAQVSDKEAIIKKATDLNYWGKRLETSKQVVILIIHDDFPDYTPHELLEILDENKPVKKATVSRETKEAKPDNRPLSAGSLSHSEQTRKEIQGKTFIVTSCQNNTELHSEFFANLVAYADHREAELIVLPFIYNKNAFQNGNGNDDIWYDNKAKEFFLTEDAWLGDNKKVFIAALNILPTVKKPLSGLQDLMKSAECMIVPHATIQHENIAVLGAQFGRVVPSMYSTGTITQRNYIAQKAGQAASGRHCFAASLIEFDDEGQFWVRQLQTDETGSFQDLNTFVQDGEIVQQDIDVLSISYGDIHAEQSFEPLANLQWGEGGMLDQLRPQYQFCHDLLDFKSLNHHNRDNNFHILKNHVEQASVEGDISQVSSILSMMDRDFCETVVVYSNHDDSLSRWLSCTKYNAFNDPENASFYYKLQVEAHDAIRKDVDFEALPTAIRLVNQLNEPVTFLKPACSFIIGGIEQACHGHDGANGARGSKVSFSNYKVTTGHTHSSSINGGQYVGGVSAKLSQGYNEAGASSWVHAAVISYENGQRTIVAIKPTKYKGMQFRA